MSRLADQLRFWSKVEVDERTGCFLFTGRLDPKGYGAFDLKDGSVRAHRYAFETFGVVPVGLELDHLCRVRCCVNPEHMEAVTHAENMRRGAHATKAHCPHGHPYDDENTYVCRDSGGGLQRLCRECRRQRARKKVES